MNYWIFITIHSLLYKTQALLLNRVTEEEPGCVARVDTDQGTKWIYMKDDLKLIGDAQYTYTDDTYQWKYLWRPCKPFDIELPPDVHGIDNSCQNSFVAWRKHSRSCYCLGHFGVIKLDKENQVLKIDYYIDEISNSPTTVKLVCNKTEISELRCEQGCEGYQPVLAFHSKYACLRSYPSSQLPLIHHTSQLSVGSYILIICGFLFIIYLVTGTIRGSIKGRIGLDRLPNSDFWFELPLLVKDGCLFVLCCRRPFIYIKRYKNDEIYQPILYDQTTPVVDL